MNWTPENLERLALCAWGEIMEFCNPDSCVLGTRVLLNALKALGEEQAFGLVVRTLVLSPEAAEHSETHGCLNNIVDCPERTPSMQIVGLGEAPDTPANGLSWRGHVVAIVRRKVMVDISISQASHPEWGMAINGVFVAPTAEMVLRGRGIADYDVRFSGSQQQLRLLYEGLPKTNPAWKQSPDWADDTELRSELVAATLARWRGEPHSYPGWMHVIRTVVGRV